LRKNSSKLRIRTGSKIIFPVLFTLIYSSLFILTSCGNEKEKPDENKNHNETTYDSLKAKEYGADEYGMKKFVMAFLKRGPNKPPDSTTSAELQKAHLKNIDRLVDEGKLVLAGPFLDNDDLRGIYLFNVESIEEAKALTSTDPAIQYGSLIMELKPWYGSAAVVGIKDMHNSISKKRL
jgi:uncharacterized protein YciI